MKKLFAAALLASVTACSMVPANPAPADPAIVAQINYVCAYSGLFKFADTTAASVVPVAEAPVQLVNAGVDQVCLHPDTVAQDVQSVKDLIATFKVAGKM